MATTAQRGLWEGVSACSGALGAHRGDGSGRVLALRAFDRARRPVGFGP